MLFIADGLLIAGALAAAFYCWVLSRRVRGLTDLDNGVGAAISALSRQVDEVKSSLDLAKAVTGASRKELSELTARAEIAAGRLELLLAALHERGEVAPNTGEGLRRAANRGRQDAQPSAGDLGGSEGATESRPSDEEETVAAADDREGAEAAAAVRGEVTPALKSVLKALDR